MWKNVCDFVTRLSPRGLMVHSTQRAATRGLKYDGQPEDIASIVSYLASKEGHFITGKSLFHCHLGAGLSTFLTMPGQCVSSCFPFHFDRELELSFQMTCQMCRSLSTVGLSCHNMKKLLGMNVG